MNIPTKVMRSNFMTFENYNYHQQIAKKFYKFQNKFKSLKDKEKSNLKNEISFNIEYKDQYSYVISGLKDKNIKLSNNYKEDILKW